MPHNIDLITLLAAGFGLALVLGLIAVRLRLPPLAGYLLAGVAISPQTPGFVGDVGLAAQLAEVGVMLLMFGVGLHFSMADLLRVKRIAIPGAVVQIAVATTLGAVVAWWWGWSLGAALVFGLCLSVASTVVLLRALEARGELQSARGQIAVGWLVVEDLVMVLVLVLLPVLAPVLLDVGTPAAAGDSVGMLMARTVAKVAAFVACMLLVGRWVLPKTLWWVARSGSQELFTLGVVAVAIGVAFGAAKLFDVSFALGAFFAGMVLRESEFSHRAAHETLPLRDAFAVLFFVSVGMLFDPAVVWQEPVKLLVALCIILLGKTVAAVALVLLLRHPLQTALTVGASLAQIGEFSFILAGLGVALNILPVQGQSLVLAAALLSIALNAALFAAVPHLRAWLVRRSERARQWDLRSDPLEQLPMDTDSALLKGHITVVGHGRTGCQVAQELRQVGVPCVVVERDHAVAENLRGQGCAVVCGDASHVEVLLQAHVHNAASVVISVQDPIAARAIAVAARSLHPGVGLVMQASDEEFAKRLRQDTGAVVFEGWKEQAHSMAQHAVETASQRPAAP